MPLVTSRNSLNTFQALVVDGQAYTYFSLKAAEQTLGDLSHLPCCMRIFLENLLRHEDDKTITVDDMRTLTAYHALHKNIPTIAFYPARFFMNDEAAVSTLTDIAALYEKAVENQIETPNLSIHEQVDIIVNTPDSFTPAQRERYRLLKWSKKTFNRISVVPPGHGPGNYININALSTVVRIAHDPNNEIPIVVPDTVLGTDPAFSTINCLGVLGWQTDPLEIQSLLLGHTSQLSLPGVLGIKLTGKIHKGSTITDIALAIAKAIGPDQAKGKIVEFYGPTLDHLSVPDRGVIAALLTQTGALCCYFPIDAATTTHLAMIGHTPHQVALVEAYARAQGLWHDSWPHDSQRDPSFTSVLEIPVDGVRPSMSGPNSPYASFLLSESRAVFEKQFPAPEGLSDPLATTKHGDLILALLSPRHTASHPMELVVAGLVARKAAAQGLRVKPWVRCLFLDTSPVTTAFLRQSGLDKDLEAIGFHLAPQNDETLSPFSQIQDYVRKTVSANRLTAVSLSCSPLLDQAGELPFALPNFIVTPPMIVGYALAGTILTDLNAKPIGTNKEGKPLLLKEIWPHISEINAVMELAPRGPLCMQFKETLFDGPDGWKQTPTPDDPVFLWAQDSYSVCRPPYLQDVQTKPRPLQNIKEARLLAHFSQSAMAQHLAPMGPIDPASQAGQYLAGFNLTPDQFGAYQTKTGNFEIMRRGALSHPALHNDLIDGGNALPGQTVHFPDKTTLTFYEAAERYHQDKIPCFIAAGQNFGAGVGQEWAAKVLRLLHVSVVIAESYDPAFRLNLIRVGVLPLQLKSGVSLADLNLSGQETVSFAGISDIEHAPCEVMVTIERSDGVDRYMLYCSLKTDEEIDIFRQGSLWASTLRTLV